MFSKYTVIYLLFVTSFFHTVRSQAVGLAINNGCTCQAVDGDNPGMVLKNFGIVMRCGGFSNCDCILTAPQRNMQSCRNVCEHVVALWALNSCPLMLRGREVRAQFQSPSCTNAVGTMGRDCGPRQCLCPCPVGLPVITQVIARPVAIAGPGFVAGDGIGIGDG